MRLGQWKQANRAVSIATPQGEGENKYLGNVKERAAERYVLSLVEKPISVGQAEKMDVALISLHRTIWDSVEFDRGYR